MTTDYATLIHKLSLGLLLLFSILTWALLLLKAWQQGSLNARNSRFAKAFWAAPDLPSACSVPANDSALDRLASAARAALVTPQERREIGHSWSRQDLLERCLRHQILKERRRLEGGMIVLASIGSTAPFIGLFGTVFGIIHALHAISQTQTASITVVAGPIGDALIATGVGIAVAVPAVLSYNFYNRRLRLIVADLDDFATDLINQAQRHGFQLLLGSATSTSQSGVA